MRASILALLILAECACNPFGCPEGEPTYFAEARKQPIAGKVVLQVTFNRKLFECVNGFESDFGWTQIQVNGPTLDGVPLKTIQMDSGKTMYIAEGTDERQPYDLSFSLDGKTYQSDWATAEVRAQTTRVSMNRQKE